MAWRSVCVAEAPCNHGLPDTAKGRQPSFFGTAKAYMDNDNREKVRRLLEFRFKRHSRYNLPSERLKMIEKQVQKRAKKLLE